MKEKLQQMLSAIALKLKSIKFLKSSATAQSHPLAGSLGETEKTTKTFEIILNENQIIDKNIYKMSEDIIRDSVERYDREVDRYVKLSELVYQICNDIIQKKLTIRATVQRRAKGSYSFQEKIKKNDYASVDDVFAKISDLAGVRIITYLESDRDKVVDEIEKVFIGKSTDNKPIIEKKDKNEDNKHYRATHCQIYLPEEFLDSGNSNLRNTTCEIQVCSLLAHVFNEIEHDLQYKPQSGIISEKEVESLNQLGLLTKSGDITIKHLLEATDERLRERTGDFDDVHDFVIRMREELKLDSTFSNNAGQLFDELILLKLTSPQIILGALTNNENKNLTNIGETEYFRLKKYIESSENEMILEDNSSDILLLALLKVKYNQIISNHPTGRGKGRPSRLSQIAKLYKEMLTKEGN